MSMQAEVQAAFAEDRRRVILRLLTEYGEAANSTMLAKAVHASGHKYSDRDMVLADIRWLSTRGLVETEDLKGDLVMVTLTEDGARVVRGDKRVPGVARPGA